MINIRPMKSDDVSLGMALASQAGWNQLETDWHRMLALEPNGCFVATWQGEPVATTTTCVFEDIGWIAMVLVEPSHRRKGIAKALMAHAITYLEAKGTRSIRLDATALGEPVYRLLGFDGDYKLVRLMGTIPSLSSKSEGEISTGDLDASIQLDRTITGTNRAKLLTRLAEESPRDFLSVRRGSKLAGYVSGRTGANARQIGPCVASDEASAQLLLDEVASCYAGQTIFVDVPTDNMSARHYFDQWGLTEQRSFLRMTRGERLKESIESIWASFGPEKG